MINYTAANTLTTFRFTHEDLSIEAAEQEFETDGMTFGAGTFVLRSSANRRNLEQVLQTAGAELGFTAYGVNSAPDVPTHNVEVPRVAILHTWSNTQSEGWVRIAFDQYEIPYDYISVHDVRDNPNLRDSYDVIVMGPSSLNALSLLRGVTGTKPIAWKRTEITPNIGVYDETDDMRGGLELSGVVNLSTFVKAGGAFVTITSSSSLPIHFGLAQGLQIKATPTLWARGGVFRTQISESSSPIAYGYETELGVYFNSSPVFATERAGRRRGFGFGRRPRAAASRGGPGSTVARRTGRGGIDEEDIVQGRRQDLGLAGVEAFEESQEDQEETQVNARFGPAAPPNNNRTIFRFAPADDLLISGGVNNAGEMSGTPALVDAPHGDGHIVMFSFNPFWRGETAGSYSLVFNTLMHYKHLDAGKNRKPATTDQEEGTR